MIFPNNQFLKVVMYPCTLIGIWHFVFEDNSTLRKIYRFYSNLIFSYYFLFMISFFIQLFVILFSPKLDVDALIENLSVTLLNTAAVLRIRGLGTNAIKKNIRKIFLLEEKILNCKDDKLIQIYNSHVFQNKVCSIMFGINYFLVLMVYVFRPLLTVDEKYVPEINETVIIRTEPLSTWMPFDQQEYYTLTYTLHEIDLVFGSSFVSCSDNFAFSLIIFALCQIRMLKLILINFQEYSLRIKNQLRCSQEEASFITMREAMIYHKEIIQYVDDYNSAMKNIMLLDFLQSSIQLASIVLSLLVNEVNLLNILYTCQYGLTMFLRLLVYYWYANEVMLQSSELGTALYMSDWYTEPLKVQKMMLVLMMRCSRELCFQIGPFTIMTLRVFLGILKGTYSYMMVVYQ